MMHLYLYLYRCHERHSFKGKGYAYAEMRLLARLRPDLLEKLTSFPRPRPSCIEGGDGKGGEGLEGRVRGGREGRER